MSDRFEVPRNRAEYDALVELVETELSDPEVDCGSLREHLLDLKLRNTMKIRALSGRISGGDDSHSLAHARAWSGTLDQKIQGWISEIRRKRHEEHLAEMSELSVIEKTNETLEPSPANLANLATWVLSLQKVGLTPPIRINAIARGILSGKEGKRGVVSHAMRILKKHETLKRQEDDDA